MGHPQRLENNEFTIIKLHLGNIFVFSIFIFLASGYFGTVLVRSRPICDDIWKNDNARVVCRSIYKEDARAFALTELPLDSDAFLMDDVNCNGNEDSLKQCSHITYHNCKKSEGAGAVCLLPSEVKISGDNGEKNMGYIYFNKIPICNSHISLNVAQVACTQMFNSQFKRGKKGVPVKTQRYGYKVSEMNMFVHNIECKGEEDSLTKCDMEVKSSCDYTIGGVTCAKCTPEDLKKIVEEVNTEGSINDVHNSIKQAQHKFLTSCYLWDDCSSQTPRYPEYCETDGFFKNALTYTKPIINKKVIILDQNLNHMGLLKHNYLKESFSSLSQKIDSQGIQFTEALGNYFQQLASFDLEVAKSDRTYTLDVWKKSNANAVKASNDLGKNLKKIIVWSFVVSRYDLASKAALLAMRIASMFNPMKVLMGDVNGVDVLESMNDVAKTGNLIAQLAYVKNVAIPDLQTLGKKVAERVDKNRKHFNLIGDIFETIEQNKPFTDKNAKEFLKMYDSFFPAIQKKDIAEYETLLEIILTKMCDVIENPETAAGAIEATKAAVSGICEKSKVQAAILVALYEEMAEQQFALMDSFAKIARAKIAENGALKLKSSIKGTVSEQLTRVITRMEALHLLRYHKVILVKNACDYITYMYYGHEPQICTNLRTNPYGDIGPLINIKTYKMSECPNCHLIGYDTHEVFLPVTTDGKDNSINLKTLIQSSNNQTNGKTTLNIPDRKWLVDNFWLAESAIDKGPYFIKKIMFFLPPALIDHQYHVNLRLKLLSSKLGGNVYFFKQDLYIDNKYTENRKTCLRTHPYTYCKEKMNKICIKTVGEIRGDLLPRLDGSTWSIELRSDVEIPMIYSANKMYLKAYVEIYYKATGSATISLDQLHLQTKQDFTSEECCRNGYFDQVSSSCRSCPANSQSQANGIFCEKCPKGFKTSGHGLYGCVMCPANTYKSDVGPGKCLDCPNGKTSGKGAYECG